MIIVRISGPLEQQLSQYAFGRECARLLQTELKLDIAVYDGDKQHQYDLNKFTVTEGIASEHEVTNTKQIGIMTEETLLWIPGILDRVRDGMYLDGVWADYRYADAGIAMLVATLQSLSAPDIAYIEMLEAIEAADSVAIDLRSSTLPVLTMPQCYFEDAIKEVRARVPNAHLFILSDQPVPQLKTGGNFTAILTKSGGFDAQYLQLMRACRHHIVTYHSLAYWAARLATTSGGITLAPQQAFRPDDADLIVRFSLVQQPVWPRSWQVMPVRITQPLPDVSSFKGGHSEGQPIRVGVWNFYEEITRNGFLFKNTEASIGANLLKPWCDLYEYGQAHGINFVTLDQISGVNDLDAVIFMDRPRAGHPLIDALMQSTIQKYLILYECEVIKPDNWEIEFHQQFDRIFTWSDVHVDGRRYIKTNFATDPNSPYDFEVLKTAFNQRKLVTIIAGAKASTHPNELYSHRVRAIHWFEASAPNDFDLYGTGWSKDMFPSYQGQVQDKLATLSHYRFAICYENAQNIPGYITEKIFDCFRAGVVPVYGGAPNIARWVPTDCYIDMGQFQTYAELYEYLGTMDSTTHGGYLDRIRRYLYSDQFYPYSTECFITTVTEVIAWDVQTSRGETPLLLQAARAVGAEPLKENLVQNLDTMRIELEAPEFDIVLPSPEQTLQASFQNAGRPDLIVFFGYGDELPVFVRARALWQFFISHYPNVRAIFVRETDKLGRGEIESNGHDLLVGIGGYLEPGKLERNGYAATGKWSPSENGRAIYRQMAVYDYLLRTHEHPFYLYTSTITSVVDFRGLFALMDSMPKTGCYAGMPGRLTNPPELDGLTFACGTNSLFSRDMMELLRNRYDPSHTYATLPNDIWQALVLQDIPRTLLPFFSFVKPRADISHDNNISVLTKRLLEQGHFHFRIKTTSAEAGYGAREDTDPWIMLKVMEAILDSHPPVQSNRQLIEKLAVMTNPKNGKTLSAYGEDGFFNGARDFPLNDLEAEIIYPDLAS
jgi:hypothetical protein